MKRINKMALVAALGAFGASAGGLGLASASVFDQIPPERYGAEVFVALKYLGTHIDWAQKICGHSLDTANLASRKRDRQEAERARRRAADAMALGGQLVADQHSLQDALLAHADLRGPLRRAFDDLEGLRPRLEALHAEETQDQVVDSIRDVDMKPMLRRANREIDDAAKQATRMIDAAMKNWENAAD